MDDEKIAFDIVDPNEYISKNSIDIVLNKKNLYMGKLSSDITNDILKQINNKFQ